MSGGARRAIWLTAVIAAVVGLSFLVARPRTDVDSPVISYSEKKGTRPPGLQIFVRRGPELRVLQPRAPVRAGDALTFVVRGAEPRYLVVRARDAAGRDRRLFPEDAQAALVQPGQTLPVSLDIGEGSGRDVVTAIFAERAFAEDGPTPEGAQTVIIELPRM